MGGGGGVVGGSKMKSAVNLCFQNSRCYDCIKMMLRSFTISRLYTKTEIDGRVMCMS